MKRLLALLLSLAMTLFGAAAWAEEENRFTLSNDMVVDGDALREAAVSLGIEGELLQKVTRRAAMLDALELTLCGDESSLQFDAAFNGNTALAFGARYLEEQGFVVASTLFPTYFITMTPDKTMGTLMKLFSMLDHASRVVISLPKPDGTPAQPSLAGDLLDYLKENLPPFPGVEKGNYEVDGVKYDSRHDLFIDHKTLTLGWESLVDLFFTSEQTAPVAEDAQRSELELTPEKLKSMLPVESLPEFSITIYRSSASPAVDYSATATSPDGTKRYAELHIQATDTTEDVTLRSDVIDADLPLIHTSVDRSGENLRARVELPTLKSTGDVEVSQIDDGSYAAQVTADIGGNYFSADIAAGPDGDNGAWSLTTRLFHNDKTEPLFQNKLTYLPEGQCTLDFDDPSRTRVAISRLVDEQDSLQKPFLVDVLLNGMTRFTNALMDGVPELKAPSTAPVQSEEVN